MSNQWKNQVERFISTEAVDNLRNIVTQLIPNRNNIPREFRDYQDIVNNNRTRLLDLLDHFTTQYSTFAFPAILTEHSAPNFWFTGERKEPNKQEAWKMIYLLLSSVQVALMNLNNIGERGRTGWRRQLVSEDPHQFFNGIISELNIHSRRWGPFYTALLAISYFTHRVRRTMRRSELGLEVYLERLHRQFGIREDTTLIIFHLARQKKEVHYFCKLTTFVRKWFREYIEGKEMKPSLLTFIDTLTTTKNLKVISPLREKLAYYLLKHNRINGDILTKLLDIKMHDSLNSKKPSGIYDAKQFFAKLHE
jgi:hypothetical protein